MTEATLLSPVALPDLTTEVMRFWEAHEEERPEETIASREHWNNIRVLAEAVRKELHGSVDLTGNAEETARQLYACVVFEFFAPRPLAEVGVVRSAPLYSPQQAGLRVFLLSGSWNATWTRLEVPLFQPVEQRWTWISIEEDEPGLLRFRDATTPAIRPRELE